MMSDIQKQIWIEKLPRGWRAYLYLGRFDRPIGIWLLMLPGWWAIALAAGASGGGVFEEWRLFLLFGVGAVVMRAAGCVVNDIWDRDLDRQVGRTKLRPLAAGDLSVRQALGFLVGLCLVGLGVLVQMNGLTIMLGVLALPLVVAYPLMKRVTWWPQMFLGLVFNFGALMGWSAVTGDLSVAAVLLYVGSLFWTLAYDTIYACQDVEDDALIGVKSTARLFGARVKLYVAGFYGLAVLCWGAVVSPLWILPVVVYMGFVLWRWDVKDARSSLRGFQRNRDLGVVFLVMVLMMSIF